MSKQLNFAQQMDEVLKTLAPARPKLLLHACCGPCSSAVLEQLLVIPRPHIHLDVDFTAEETKILGSVGFSARIGTLLRIGMTVAIPGLRWLLAYMKKKKQAPVGKDESNGHGKEKPAA